MRKYILSILSILFVASMAAGEASYTLSESTFNFGRTPQHVIVTHDFWVKSTGDEPLRIEKVNPGCGCTTIPMPDSLVMPGDSARLQIVLDTKNFRGRINKKPSFKTNIDSAMVSLKLYAEMVTNLETATPLRITPAKVNVSQFGPKPRRRAKLMIRNYSEEPFKLSPVDTAFRSFAIKLPELIAPGDSAEIFIVVHKDAVETEFKQSITFEALGETERIRYTIPVMRTYYPEGREAGRDGK